MDMIDQIGGWRSVGSVGARYGEGYGVEQIREMMKEALAHTKGTLMMSS